MSCGHVSGHFLASYNPYRRVQPTVGNTILGQVCIEKVAKHEPGSEPVSSILFASVPAFRLLPWLSSMVDCDV